MPDSPLRVLLVVGDDVAVADAVRQADRRIDVVERASLEETVGALDGGGFDCVVFDHDLPDGTGLGLLQARPFVDGRVPVIVLTGQDDPELAAQLIKAGASDYLAKDRVDAERLVRRIRTAVRLHRAERRALDAQAAVDAERLLLRAVLSQMPVGVVLAEAPDGRVQLSNPRVEEILGAPWSDAGAPGCVGHRSDRTAATIRREDWPLLRAIAGAEVDQEELDYERRDGSRVVVLASASPIRAADDAIVAAVMTLQDLTEKQLLLDRTRRAVATRDRVLSVVSHDLRSPLGAIRISADSLARVADGDPRAERALANILRSIEQADHLIRDLLDVSRSQAGEPLKVTPRPCDPGRLLLEASEVKRPAAARKSISIDCEVAPDLDRVRADSARIQQVLTNLIENALRHTPAGGTITLSVRGHASASGEPLVAFEVTDTGAGIDPDHLRHIFDWAWQGASVRRGAAGLGLAICRGIVEAHGGRIWAESRPDRGSSFAFTLPAASPGASGRTGRPDEPASPPESGSPLP